MATGTQASHYRQQGFQAGEKQPAVPRTDLTLRALNRHRLPAVEQPKAAHVCDKQDQHQCQNLCCHATKLRRQARGSNGSESASGLPACSSPVVPIIRANRWAVTDQTA